MTWYEVLYGLAALVLSGGGIGVIYKARKEAKNGLKQVEINGDIAISDQWRQIIETQTKAIVDPLVAQVARLQGDVTVLQEKVESLQSEKTELIRRADSYEDYIEVLVNHIRNELPPPEPERPFHLKPLR